MHFKPKVVGAAAAEAPPPPPPEPPPPPPPPASVVVRGLVREKGTREPIVGADVSVIVSAPRPDGRLDRRGRRRRGRGRDGRRRALRGPRARAARAARHRLGHGARAVRARLLGGRGRRRRARRVDVLDARGARRTIYETRVRADAAHPEETKLTLSKVELTTVPGTLGDPLRVVQSLPGVARAPFGLGLLIVRGANPTDTGAFIDTLNVPRALSLPRRAVGDLGQPRREARLLPGRLRRALRALLGRPRRRHAAHRRRPPGPRLRRRQRARLVGVLRGARGRAAWRVSAAVAPQLHRRAAAALHPQEGRLDLRHGRARSTTTTRRAPSTTCRDGGQLVIEAFGSDDRLDVVAQDPRARSTSTSTRARTACMAMWTASAGQWVSHFRPAYGYGVQSFSLGTNSGAIRYHRLFFREDLTRTFGPRFTFATGFDGLLSYDTRRLRRARAARRPQHRRHEPVSRRRLTRRLFDTAPAVYAEGQWSAAAVAAPRARAALRLLPRRRHRQVQRRPAPLGALGRDAAPRRQGDGRPLPPAADAAVPRQGVRQPEPRAHLGRSVRARRRAALHRRHQPVGDGLLRAAPRPARAVGRSLLEQRAGAAPTASRSCCATRSRRTSTAGSRTRSRARRRRATWPRASPWARPSGIDRSGADLTWRPSEFDQTHNLIVVASYSRWGWTLGGRYRFVTGVPTTPVAGSFYDADYNGYTRVERRARLGAPAQLQPARRAARARLDLRRLDARRVPRRAERLQRREPRGHRPTTIATSSRRRSAGCRSCRSSA